MPETGAQSPGFPSSTSRPLQTVTAAHSAGSGLEAQRQAVESAGEAELLRSKRRLQRNPLSAQDDV